MIRIGNFASAALPLPAMIVTAEAVGGPVPVESRTGRHNQKYTDCGERLIAGCIPIRYVNGQGGSGNVEVLQLAARGEVSKGWVFPKGGWELDESMESAAKRETLEEAGVRGSLKGPVLGSFPFFSKKMENLWGMKGHKCIAYMYVMVVEEELAIWPESKNRVRRWWPLQLAAKNCKYEWMRDALHAFIKREGWLDVFEDLQHGTPDSCISEEDYLPAVLTSELSVSSEVLLS